MSLSTLGRVRSMARDKALTPKRITPAIRMQWLADRGGWEFDMQALVVIARKQAKKGVSRGVCCEKRLRRAFRSEYYRQLDALILASQAKTRESRKQSKEKG